MFGELFGFSIQLTVLRKKCDNSVCETSGVLKGMEDERRHATKGVPWEIRASICHFVFLMPVDYFPVLYVYGFFRSGTLSIGFWELKISAGTYSVYFRLLGYESVVVPDVFVSSRKRRILPVSMKETMTVLEEVTITSDTRDYGRAGAIRINPSELSHIPGHANDPVRMLTSMPGINNTGTGILWRIEGIEVFNPRNSRSGR
jgi:hypothetical protein